jgi:hypothetical protein
MEQSGKVSLELDDENVMPVALAAAQRILPVGGKSKEAAVLGNVASRRRPETILGGAVGVSKPLHLGAFSVYFDAIDFVHPRLVDGERSFFCAGIRWGVRGQADRIRILRIVIVPGKVLVELDAVILQVENQLRRFLQIVQGPHQEFHGVLHSRRVHHKLVADGVVPAASHGILAGTEDRVQRGHFPHDGSLTATGYYDEVSALGDASVVDRKTLHSGDFPLGPPLAADFAGFCIEPAASFIAIVNVSDVVVALPRTKYAHETAIVGGGGNVGTVIVGG